MTEQPDDQQPVKEASPSAKPKHSMLYYWIKRISRLIFNAAKGFMDDDCYAKASALAFYSLLSIVPVLAVLFGIAKGFGFGQALESEISSRFFEQPEVTSKLIQFAYSWLQTVKGGVIAGVGTIVLLWTVISLLNNVESALNAIWKIKAGRPYVRKISDYLTVFFIAPLFFVASSSINIYLTTQITEIAQSNVFVGAISPVLLFVLNLFPFFLTWILFTFIYIFMPNAKVYFRDAIIAGVIAGTAFQLWQWIYIQFQVGVSSYGAIYGSFAALPLFLIWLQVSWLIVLAGAEMAVEVENDLFISNQEPHPLSIKAAALLVVYKCVQAFAKGERPLTDLQLARKLGISLNHLHRILEVLSKGRILSEVSFADKTFGYQPARAVEEITIQMVCGAVDKIYEIPTCTQDTVELQKIESLITEMNKAAANSSGNKPLYSL
jgi:membrane protein